MSHSTQHSMRSDAHTNFACSRTWGRGRAIRYSDNPNSQPVYRSEDTKRMEGP